MLLAGFDAGQTKTRCRIGRWQDGRWEPIGDGYGPAFVTWHQPEVWSVSRKPSAVVARSDERPPGLSPRWRCDRR
jgi:phenylacetic acid degradation operon negative regulatory protein